MKVIVKKFSVNVDSWSNKEVARFLNSLLNPNKVDAVIKSLTKDQEQAFKQKFNELPKLPASFKDIYQQFKSAKIKNVDEKSIRKDLNKLSDELDADVYLEDGKLIVRAYDKAYGDSYTSYYETDVDKLKSVKYKSDLYPNLKDDKYTPNEYELEFLEKMNKFAKSHQIDKLLLIVEFD